MKKSLLQLLTILFCLFSPRWWIQNKVKFGKAIKKGWNKGTDKALHDVNSL